VPASSLSALHQLLLHDSNKNKSEVVVSAPSRAHYDDSLPRSSSPAVPALFGSSSSSAVVLPSTSTQRQRPDEQTDSWQTRRAEHFSMPSVLDFL